MNSVEGTFTLMRRPFEDLPGRGGSDVFGFLGCLPKEQVRADRGAEHRDEQVERPAAQRGTPRHDGCVEQRGHRDERYHALEAETTGQVQQQRQRVPRAPRPARRRPQRGEVTLRVVPLGSEGESLRVRLEVADTGIGIAPENQSRIFEEFTQEDPSTTRRFGGTGLGLAIVKKAVELHGGEIGLTSAVGSGTRFTVMIPLRPVKQPAGVS